MGMTRLEAIKIASKHGLAGQHQLVDCLADLGLLKFDDTSAYRQMIEIACGYMDHGSAVQFGKELTATRLKIVEV
jgi:hypothetical protein